MNVRKIIVDASFIAIISVLSGLIYNSCSNKRLDLYYQLLDANPNAEVDITLVQAYDLFQTGEALFIDVRSSYSYKREHITNAISIPAKSTDAELNEFLKGISKDQLIVAYCSGST